MYGGWLPDAYFQPDLTHPQQAKIAVSLQMQVQNKRPRLIGFAVLSLRPNYKRCSTSFQNNNFCFSYRVGKSKT